MPFSTLAPSQPEQHPKGPNDRWLSKHNRTDAAQETCSLSEMQKLDSTALYDRSDWPLPSPSADHEEEKDQSQVDSAKAFLQHGNAGTNDQHFVDDNAVLRRPVEIGGHFDGSAYLAHSDVSDIEEESNDGDDHGRSQSSPSASRTSQCDIEVDAPEGATERRSHRLSLAPQRNVAPDVSPVREQDALQARESPTSEQPSPPPRQQETFYMAANEYDTEEEPEREEDGSFDSGDSAASIPAAGDQRQPETVTTPQLANGHTSSSSPNMNGTSIANVPMPSHRRVSARTSWISTTQISHNKNRVRYSWQSMQDDEPNRPRIHIIKLYSNTVTASAGFPTGEAFGFSISPGGRRIAVFNSARLYILQTNALPVGISQDYALKRRPLDVELTDEGNTMAILADDHTINIYDFGLSLKRTRTIKLDFPTSCIALAPSGGILAAAYEGGVEVFSLAASALETDRRAVRSPRMDRLSFSEDGSTLLGTTTRINVSSTVVVSVPVFPAALDGVPTHEELKEAWCSELLHPENIRNSSHATFMREGRTTTNERVFAWNGLEDTFGILNVGDMHYGNIDFPVVISPPLSTCGGLGAAIHSCPAIDEHGNTAAMIVNDRTVRLYIVPHNVDEDARDVEAHSIDHELDEGYGCPFHEVRWVYSSATLPAPTINEIGVKGRLIVTSPGGVNEAGLSEESVEEVEGGRIIMFDFDPQFAGQPGQTFNLTLGKSPPQTLEEEQVNVAEQVALVRRRTVNQSKGLSQRPTQLGRAATTYGGRSVRNARSNLSDSTAPARPNRSSILSLGSMHSEATRSLPDLAESNEAVEAVEALEEPYVQGAPRSQASLQRAASNVQRHRFQTLEERQQERITSDSHGHFLPLPEYTEEPNAPLPSRYRAMAGLDAPAIFSPAKPAVSSTDIASASSSSAGPHTAPPDVGETFSADLAFRNANAQAAAIRETSVEPRHSSNMSPSQQTTPTSVLRPDMNDTTFAPPSRGINGTLDSTNVRFDDRTQHSRTPSADDSFGSAADSRGAATSIGTGTYNGNVFSSYHGPAGAGAFSSAVPLPRNLQRAYSNAVSSTSGPLPSLTGDWRNANPPGGLTTVNSYAGPLGNHHPGLLQSSSGTSTRDEPWDMISPVSSSNRHSRLNENPYRYSMSMSYSTGQGFPQRAPSSAGSFTTTVGTSSAPSSAGGRRMPPHMHAFRAAAAANPSASLFPPNQAPDHVPLRHNTVRAGTVAHPITGWRPPAPSAPAPSAQLRNSGSVHRHNSRKGAFPTTAKAKKLGFFKRSKKPDPFAASSQSHQEGGSVMETRSMFTTLTKGESKCSAM